MKKEDCIFCKIVSGVIPSRTIYEDDSFIVILDLEPAAKGHSLIIPRQHAENLYELSDEAAGKVMVLAKRMATVMKEKLCCDGMNLVQNNGKTAGQTVHHFHIHMIPRYVDDGQNINWIPRKVTQEELDTVRKEIVE